MAFQALSEALLREAWEAFAAAGYNALEAARRLNLPRSTFENRLRQARRRLNLQVPEKQLTGPEAPQSVVRTLQDDVTHRRALDEAARAKSRLKDALGELARLQDRLKHLEWAAHASTQPADWTLAPRRAHAKSEHIPYLFTSDFQIGEVVRAEETEHGCAYDTEVFRRRYRRLIETTIYLSHEHAGATWTYPGIIYARGGDTISGGIHEELRDTDDLTPIEACEVAFEEESAGIYKLLEAFGRVEVKDCGGGNHDRSTHKPRSKRAVAHSYDRVISYMLRREFRNDTRVSFQTTESPDVYFPIYDMRILLTHGDKIGSRGGEGFIGPVATIARGAQKVIMEQAALGRQVDRVDVGHFHTPMYMGWYMCNGTTVGYSEYAKMHRLRPSGPQQFLLYHHSKHGVVDIKPILLGGS